MGKRNKNKNQNSPSTFKTNSKVGKNKPTTPLSEGKKKALKQNVESVKQLITLPKETSTNIAKQKKQGKPPKTNESPKKSMSSDSTQSPESNGKQQLGGASNSDESKKKRKKNNKNKQHDITLSSPSNINLPIEKPLSKKARRKLKKQQQDKGDFISLKSNVNQEKKNETNKSSNITFDLSQGKNLFDSGSDEESCEDEKMEVETIPKKLKSLPSAVGKTVSANQNSGRKPQSALAKPNIIDFGSDDGEEDDEESDDSTSKLNKTKPKSSKSDTTSSSEYLSLDVSSIESCVSSVKSPRKRKSDDSSDESELEGKDILNDEADSSDESELEGKDIINDEADSSDESELEGKDFIDDEAEEGNETSGDDDSENVDHKQESPAPSPTKRRKFEPEEDTDENKVFVGGLAPNTKEEDLREALSEAGKVLSVLVPSSRDVPGECRGFAFVTLADQESLQNVLELSNNAEVNGKVIFIRKYKSDHGRGGGRGSRGRGNFRGGRGGGRGSGEGFRGGRGSGEGFRGGRGGFRGGRGGYDRDSFGGNRGGFRGGRGGNFRGGRGGFNRGSGRGSSRGSKNFF